MNDLGCLITRAAAEALRVQETQEVMHRLNYPDAIGYGRHASGGLKDVHWLTVGGEYVGRHRPVLGVRCVKWGDPIREHELNAKLDDGSRIHLPCPRLKRGADLVI